LMTAAKTETAAKTDKPRKARWRMGLAALRHAAAWVLTVTTLLLGLAIGGMFFLQTDKGLRFLERNITRFASTDDMQVALRLQRIGWHHIVIPAVELTDAK